MESYTFKTPLKFFWFISFVIGFGMFSIWFILLGTPDLIIPAFLGIVIATGVTFIEHMQRKRIKEIVDSMQKP